MSEGCITKNVQSSATLDVIYPLVATVSSKPCIIFKLPDNISEINWKLMDVIQDGTKWTMQKTTADFPLAAKTETTDQITWNITTSSSIFLETDKKNIQFTFPIGAKELELKDISFIVDNSSVNIQIDPSVTKKIITVSLISGFALATVFNPIVLKALSSLPSSAKVAYFVVVMCVAAFSLWIWIRKTPVYLPDFDA